MTVLIENETSFYLSTPATVLDLDRDVAAEWASAHIVRNPAIKWIVGKYVEADNANSNGQYWSLEDLQLKQPTIQHSPMNVAHRPTNIIGTYVASEMLYPTTSEANPYIETVGAAWKYYFPDELAMVEAAYNVGALYQSMECISDTITCVGPNGCNETFDYRGPMDSSYCEHIRDRSGFRQLNNPHFLAGALIYPPDRPGWKGASVNELSNLVSDEKKHEIIHSIASESPHLSPTQWEQMMFSVIERTITNGKVT